MDAVTVGDPLALIRQTLESDRSHELTHLFNLLGVALSDGEITEARARLSELRESHGVLFGEIAEAADSVAVELAGLRTQLDEARTLLEPSYTLALTYIPQERYHEFVEHNQRLVDAQLLPAEGQPRVEALVRAVRAEDERDRALQERAQVERWYELRKQRLQEVADERDRLREVATYFDGLLETAASELVERGDKDFFWRERVADFVTVAKSARKEHRAALAGAAVQTGRATGENSLGDDQRSSVAEEGTNGTLSQQ